MQPGLWPVLPLLVSPLLTGLAASPDAWPQFRGPHGSGANDRADFPSHFGPGSNLLWKATVPGGHGSPCIIGDRIFLTGFAEGKLLTLCLDQETGGLLWRRSLSPTQLEPGSRNSSPATATPAADRRRVCVYFGSFGLAAYDHQGRELWAKPLPVPITQHGAGTSPVLADNRLILVVDQDVGSYLLAVDADTGRTLWKRDRPGFRRGFSTPLLWPAAQPRLAIVAGTLRLVAYDLSGGSERWAVRGLPNELVASPVAGSDLVFVAGWTYGSGVRVMPPFDRLLAQGDRDHDGQLTRAEAPGGPARQHFLYIDADKDGRINRQEWESIADIFNRSENALLAIRPTGRGDVTDSHVVWKQTRGLPYVPSPLCYQGRLYLVKNGGLASCFDAATGRVHYQEERLGALGDYYASPVAAGGKICAASQPGTVVVYQAGDTLEILARNKFDEPILATPAIVDHTLFLRTTSHLYAFRRLRPVSGSNR